MISKPDKIKEMLPATASSEDYPHVLQFFEKWLRQGSPCRLEEEYPLAFSPQSRENIFILPAENGIQAGLTTLKREIEVKPGFWVQVLFVGSVVTDPSCRRQGLQRVLFRQVEEKAKEESIDCIVLWSNQIEFYQRLGFQLGGLQASWFATHSAPLIQDKISVKVHASRNHSLTQKHFEAFQRKSCCVRRSFEEMEKLWRIPQMSVASTENAYVLMGKGEDFREVCHEWAGPASEVLTCFDALRKHSPHLRILSPGATCISEEMVVVQKLEQSSFECRLEYLALFKILSAKMKSEGLEPDHLRYPFFIWGLDSI